MLFDGTDEHPCEHSPSDAATLVPKARTDRHGDAMPRNDVNLRLIRFIRDVVSRTLFVLGCDKEYAVPGPPF